MQIEATHGSGAAHVAGYSSHRLLHIFFINCHHHFLSSKSLASSFLLLFIEITARMDDEDSQLTARYDEMSASISSARTLLHDLKSKYVVPSPHLQSFDLS